MDNLHISEKNTKISDSAYSNSCSNSQSTRSSSSGSSGYGGKPSTSSSRRSSHYSTSNTSGPGTEKRSKGKDNRERKKKKHTFDDLTTKHKAEVKRRPYMCLPTVTEDEKEQQMDVTLTTSTVHMMSVSDNEITELSTSNRNSANDESMTYSTFRSSPSILYPAPSPPINFNAEGFSCVVSMNDGIVMYTTSSLTSSLGFLKEMWIGRLFIDFVHLRDRNLFESQVSNGLAAPTLKHGTQAKAMPVGYSVSAMACRLRRYRSLNEGFKVKERMNGYMPFLLKLSFKNISNEDGNAMYLVIQATPYFSAFKVTNEKMNKAPPFVMRHSASGNLEFVEHESVPFLGYMPQEVVETNILQLYHPDDLCYLRQMYEIIVKDGVAPRSKPYRMLTHNGDYLKLESEWTSFINPWSRKLEFITGRHHVIEGPANPEVFLDPKEKDQVSTEEEVQRIEKAKDSIITIMNEVPIRPIEVVKQQMKKRCHDLASILESLVEEQPKIDEELRLDIQDADTNCFERDSVMLGGISPHHDYNDGKSSTGTLMSYTQLNYNETLERYFDSHHLDSYNDYTAPDDENLPALKFDWGNQLLLELPTARLPPVAQNSDIITTSSDEIVTSDSPKKASAVGDYRTLRLTESLLIKHNSDMEKEMVKVRREARPSGSKCEREKTSNDKRQKKIEHLARCNAAFQPTAAGGEMRVDTLLHGVKRSSSPEQFEAQKHHCPSRQARRKRGHSPPLPVTVEATTAAPSATTYSLPRNSNPMDSVNTIVQDAGIPQVSFVGPMTTNPGMVPMLYAIPSGQPIGLSAPNFYNQLPHNTSPHFPTPMSIDTSMMHDQMTMYSAPFMYSPINCRSPFTVPQTLPSPSIPYSDTVTPLRLASSNYEEACKIDLSRGKNTETGIFWRNKKRGDTYINPALILSSSKTEKGSAVSSSALNRSTETVSGTMHGDCKSLDRTDEGSSYSSFYSSFFKTESGSAEDSGDGKKRNKSYTASLSSSDRQNQRCKIRKTTRRSIPLGDPSWMNQVCVTSQLVYKYQITTKNADEVLTDDKAKIDALKQPLLVNDQLEQLYLELQLEGAIPRLTLEEGITSSSSSGDEVNSVKANRKKKEYSKLVMMYEENAPFPPVPSWGNAVAPDSS